MLRNLIESGPEEGAPSLEGESESEKAVPAPVVVVEPPVEELPVDPNPEIGTEGVFELPPIEDPEYVPGTQEELAKAAFAVGKSIPSQNVEQFWKELDRLAAQAETWQEDETMKTQQATIPCLDSTTTKMTHRKTSSFQMRRLRQLAKMHQLQLKQAQRSPGLISRQVRRSRKGELLLPGTSLQQASLESLTTFAVLISIYLLANAIEKLRGRRLQPIRALSHHQVLSSSLMILDVLWTVHVSS
jgi:hypothetical protein